MKENKKKKKNTSNLALSEPLRNSLQETKPAHLSSKIQSKIH
jgi:hypothetical protein